MTIQITGKNIDIGDALRTYCIDKVEAALDKYVGRDFPGHVRIEKIRNNFESSFTLNLWNGMVVQASGSDADPHNSVDEAMEKLEKRLRRNKRRLKSHHQKHGNNAKEFAANGAMAMDYTVQPGDPEEGTGEETTPVVVAEDQSVVGEMSVSDAVMKLDLADQPVLIFKNTNNGDLNIVYRRDDGNIGWIEPK